MNRTKGGPGRVDADAAEVAMLEDRIRVSEGRLQRYGTQFDWSEDWAIIGNERTKLQVAGSLGGTRGSFE